MQLIWCGGEPTENIKEYVADLQQAKELSNEIEVLNSEIAELEEKLRILKPKTIEKNPHYLNVLSRIVSFDPLKYQKCIQCLLVKSKYEEIYAINGCTCKQHIMQDQATGTSDLGIFCICNPNYASILRYE